MKHPPFLNVLLAASLLCAVTACAGGEEPSVAPTEADGGSSDALAAGDLAAPEEATILGA